MTKSSEKGFQYERDIAGQISLWWTGGRRRDVFWRIGGSGGRARIRAEKGLETTLQHGDIQAVDPVGADLLRVTIIEIKRGYNRHTFQDLIDKPEGAAEQKYEEWIRKGRESSKQANTPFWMVIVKRDRRDPLVLLPTEFIMIGRMPVTEAIYTGDGSNTCLVPLADFFEVMDPEDVKAFAAGTGREAS